MEPWKYEPARDRDLSPVERARSLRREAGLLETAGHLAWLTFVKFYLRVFQRLSVRGRENIPHEPPFVLVVARADGVVYSPVTVTALPEGGPLVVTVRPLGDTITVLSGAPPDLEVPPAAAAAVLGRREIEERAPGDLAQALEGVPGASVSGVGPAEIPAVRGLPKGRTLLILDGGRLAAERLDERSAHFQAMRDRLHEGLRAELDESTFRVNGHPERRLPNTLNVSFRGVEANTLLSEIGDEVAASAGAACHSEDITISPVLEAMRVPLDWAMGTVRFSVGRNTTAEEIDHAVGIVAAAVKRMQPGGEVAVEAPQADETQVKLTHFTHGMGCACKLRPQALEKVLASLPVPVEPALLVGAEHADDAAVYRLSDETAIVQTVDFFTPIVDDPYWFGAISAANSLSDIYAMGARPLFALNIVGFPSNRLPLRVLERILEGAQAKAEEAGIVIAGGHTVDDSEPKFGLAVTGIVHPDALLRNDTARPGDVLILTKPLGVGIVSTAVKRGLTEEGEAREAAEVMAALNRSAAEAMQTTEVSACTDITGFGFLGHLREMAAGSGVDMVVETDAVPVLASAERYATGDVIPGGTLNNLAHVEPHVAFHPKVSRVTRLILADAQTSGGLLISLPEEKADGLLHALHEAGVTAAAVVGRVTGPGEGHITVRG